MSGQNNEPGEIYWKAIEPFWKKVSIYDGGDVFLAQFKQLRPEIGNLFATCWLQSEVYNGGFHQFFSNPTGVLAPEAAAGFQTIGLVDISKVVREAMSFFGSLYPREQEVRLAFLTTRGGTREERDPFFKLDERFYELLGEDQMRFDRSADAYAMKIVD
jgi:hypothetical protein